LKKEVTNIKWNSNSSEKIAISCTDGSYYNADHVIFTASLGVLKDRHQSLFTPKLPETKIKAIESIGFGTLGKIFLEFDKPFWPTDVNEWVGFIFLWTDADLNAIKATDREW
jgi:monoamine oxidase